EGIAHRNRAHGIFGPGAGGRLLQRLVGQRARARRLLRQGHAAEQDPESHFSDSIFWSRAWRSSSPSGLVPAEAMAFSKSAMSASVRARMESWAALKCSKNSTSSSPLRRL